MQFNLKGENVVISMKRNFPKIAKIITLKNPVVYNCKNQFPQNTKNRQFAKTNTRKFFAHTVYSESLEDLLHLV